MKFLSTLLLIVTIAGCSTVSGVGKDIQSAADWSHDKVSGGPAR